MARKVDKKNIDRAFKVALEAHELHCKEMGMDLQVSEAQQIKIKGYLDALIDVTEELFQIVVVRDVLIALCEIEANDAMRRIVTRQMFQMVAPLFKGDGRDAKDV